MESVPQQTSSNIGASGNSGTNERNSGSGVLDQSFISDISEQLQRGSVQNGGEGNPTHPQTGNSVREVQELNVEQLVAGIVSDATMVAEETNQRVNRVNDVINASIEQSTEQSDVSVESAAAENEIQQEIIDLPISNELAGIVFFAMNSAAAGFLPRDKTIDLLRQFYAMDTGAPLKIQHLHSLIHHKKVHEYIDKTSENFRMRKARQEEFSLERLDAQYHAAKGTTTSNTEHNSMETDD